MSNIGESILILVVAAGLLAPFIIAWLDDIGQHGEPYERPQSTKGREKR